MKKKKMPVSTILRLRPYFPPQIIPCRSENYPNSVLLTPEWGRAGRQDGRKKSNWKTLLEKGRELVKTCLAGLGNTVGKQVKIPLENKILTWFVGKRQQAYFIIHHPKGTRFHFHCLMLMAFLGYSLSLLPLSWIYLLISLHFVLFLDQWQWCEHTIIKSDSQKVKNLLAHL